MDYTAREMKVAFVVGVFPATSETFIINQIADLLDRGIDVRIFSFQKGLEYKISDRYYSYRMSERVTFLDVPESKVLYLLYGLYIVMRLIFQNPRALLRASRSEYSGSVYGFLKVLFWIRPFLGDSYDVTHCHFGTIAAKYCSVRSILQEGSKLVTTFYGYDVSHIPREKGLDCYKKLSEVCSKFLVMSENMKSRVLLLGIPEDKIHVHPVSIDVDSYEFHGRTMSKHGTINIISVGRFVEKKGFDVLLRALKIVKERSTKPFRLQIVGDGELHDEIQCLANELKVTDVIDFKGSMKMEDILHLYNDAHLYIQSSKTAKNGDME